MKHTFFTILLCGTTTLAMAQSMSSFDEFRKGQQDKFNKFRQETQEDYNAFRRQVNEEYAEFMRNAWESFHPQPAVEPVKEPVVKPVVYQENRSSKNEQDKQEELAQNTTVTPRVIDKQKPNEENKNKQTAEPENKNKQTVEPEPEEERKQEQIDPIKPDNKPLAVEEPKVIPVKPEVVVVPQPEPAPAPIAPVEVKEEKPCKMVSVSFYGTLVSVGFPKDDKFHLSALNEQSLSDAWKQLAGEKYDITVNNVLKLRDNMQLCDWAYMRMLQAVTEKQYGKTNEAVYMQVYLMTQSGYRVRMGYSSSKKRLYMLLASQYGICNMPYYTVDGKQFYPIDGADVEDMHICKAKFEKERSLNLQISREQKFDMASSDKRTLTSKKGVTASVSVNKNMISFYETYPRGYVNGDVTTCWVAYANTPLEKSIQNNLYPTLSKTIQGLSERDAVGLILNWVQTAFVYGYDDEIWGQDRPFFPAETLYYPYCDCEDRAILFSRIVRDLLKLDVVLLYYPGHLAAAVAFNGQDVKGDYLTYKKRNYIVCDPTYIGAGVGKTMPGMDNQKARIVALK